MKSNTVINHIDEVIQAKIFAFIKDYHRAPEYIYLGELEYHQLQLWWIDLMGDSSKNLNLSRYTLDTHNGYDIIAVNKPSHLGLGI